MRPAGPYPRVWACETSILPPVAAKYSLDGDIFSLILLRKIREKMSPSEYNLGLYKKVFRDFAS